MSVLTVVDENTSTVLNRPQLVCIVYSVLHTMCSLLCTFYSVNVHSYSIVERWCYFTLQGCAMKYRVNCKMQTVAV